jgi:hypothetical protein
MGTRPDSTRLYNPPPHCCPHPVQLTLFEDDPQPARQARSDIRRGDAAEAFVIAKLLKAGFDAHGARRDAPYDVGVDLGSGRYCRIQVKGCERPRHGKWHFRFVRGNPRTGAGSYAYSNTDFDITACVALSLERVVFAAGVQPSIRLSTADFLRPATETESWARALDVFNRNH